MCEVYPISRITISQCFSCFPNCLSKLPIQVPYKFRVESPASIITTWCTYGLEVKHINDIECFGAILDNIDSFVFK